MKNQRMCMIKQIGILTACFLSYSAWGQPYSSFAPDWKIGQIWKVKVVQQSEAPGLPPERLANWVPTTGTLTYEFTVEGMREIEEERCYRIRLDAVKVGNKTITPRSWGYSLFYRLYFREDDKTLKCLERIGRKRGDLTDIIESTSRYTRGPVSLDVAIVGVPLDWPFFAAEKDTYDPDVAPLMPRKGFRGRHPSEATQQCVVKEEMERREQSKAKKELRVTLEYPRRTRSTQVWREGMPWWIEMTQEWNGKVIPARLVEVDGKPVAPSLSGREQSESKDGS